jgi:hypothetical protein
MFSTTAGHLVLRDLAIELDIPREVPAENWSLFEILGAQHIRLERCWLTIRNASDQQESYHPDTAFFRVTSPRGAEDAAPAGAASASTASINLENCVVRGEAILLRTETRHPPELWWQNGLLATTECLLKVLDGPEPPRSDEARKIQITLQHVTAVLRGGLCRTFCAPAASWQCPTRIAPSECIFLGKAGVPFVEQFGVDTGGEYRHWLQWSADHNCYQDWDVFWAVTAADRKTPVEPLLFDGWQRQWLQNESLPEINRLIWKKLPEAGRPMHAHTPADYAWGGAGGDKPARGADAVGFEVDQLPSVPAEPMGPAAATQAAAGQPQSPARP